MATPPPLPPASDEPPPSNGEPLKLKTPQRKILRRLLEVAEPVQGHSLATDLVWTNNYFYQHTKELQERGLIVKMEGEGYSLTALGLRVARSLSAAT